MHLLNNLVIISIFKYFFSLLIQALGPWFCNLERCHSRLKIDNYFKWRAINKKSHTKTSFIFRHNSSPCSSSHSNSKNSKRRVIQAARSLKLAVTVVTIRNSIMQPTKPEAITRGTKIDIIINLTLQLLTIVATSPASFATKSYKTSRRSFFLVTANTK